MLINITSPIVNVSTPFTNFSGTITVPATNPSLLHIFPNFPAVSSGLGVNVNYFPLPALSPGQSYSGVLFQVITVPYKLPASSNVYVGAYYVSIGLTNNSRAFVATTNSSTWQLTMLPSVAVLGW